MYKNDSCNFEVFSIKIIKNSQVERSLKGVRVSDRQSGSAVETLLTSLEFLILLIVLVPWHLDCFASGVEPDSAAKARKAFLISCISQVSAQVKKHWSPPESGPAGHVVVTWKIYQDGRISNLKVTKHSANKDDDRAAVNAVQKAAPFKPLPKGSAPIEIEYNFERESKVTPLGLTVKQALKKYGPAARKRMLPCFQLAQLDYPPRHVNLVCLKEENLLLVFAARAAGKWKQVKCYSLVSRSGVQGPKLKEGDMQVPEGYYKITGLDAMTHLALLVNYPSATDRARARLDRRSNPGSNIQIHAGSHSTGCLVLTSDDTAELLTLAHDVGCAGIDLIIAPCNLITEKPSVDFTKQPEWLPGLYKELRKTLSVFPVQLPVFQPYSK
jgi:TonB family protein